MARVPTRTHPVRSGIVGAITLALTAGALAQQPGGSQVYRYEDAQGRVVYSDRPPPPGACSLCTSMSNRPNSSWRTVASPLWKFFAAIIRS